MKRTIVGILTVVGVLTTALLMTSVGFGQQAEGTKGLSIVTRTGRQYSLYDDYYALVIGVSDYDHWPTLQYTVQDAKEVSAHFKASGFNVKQVINPTSDELNQAFVNLRYGAGGVKNRAIVVFFSGHGETETLADGTEMGYIVPADCPLRRSDPVGFGRKAISMADIHSLALGIQSKHVLMIFDSCFSGSVFNMVKSPPLEISEKSALPVRQFITAGGSGETVPDRSQFKICLLQGLAGEADLYKDDYITGAELGMYLHAQVVKYTKAAQHPQYGKINNAKLDKGDFIFGAKAVSAPPALKGDGGLGEYAKRISIRQQWKERLDEMQTAFDSASESDKSSLLTAQEKVDMWRLFAKTYTADNPFENADDELRSKANERLLFWEAEIERRRKEEEQRWAARQARMKTRYQESLRTDAKESVSLEQKIREWEGLLFDFAENDPNSTDDDKIREEARSRVRHWRNEAAERRAAAERWATWQAQMLAQHQESMREDESDSTAPEEKVRVWRSFLSSFGDDNPQSTDDNMLRQEARVRLQYWEAEVAKRQAAAQRWATWQSQMRDQHQDALKQDEAGSMSPDEKVRVWEGFLARFADNNPNSNEDEKLRGEARVRLEYWHDLAAEQQAAAERWAAWQTQLETQYQVALKKDKSVSASAEEKIRTWESFLAAFIENNPNSTDDEALKNEAQAKLNSWVDQIAARDAARRIREAQQARMELQYQHALRTDRKKSVGADEKARDWRDFLSTFAEDNPDSSEDEKLRSEAHSRLQYWEAQAAKQRAQAQIWADWQTQLETEYQQALTKDKAPSIGAEEKARAWEDFLSAFTESNPDSAEDERLKTEARGRQQYWEGEAAKQQAAAQKWAGWQARMKSQHQNAIKSDQNESIAPQDKVRVWREFLSTFSEDDPSSAEDEAFRREAQARLKYWRDEVEKARAETRKWQDWQEDMRSEFGSAKKKENRTFFFGPSDKAEMWRDFLSTFSKDNPNTTEDEELRKTAQERAEYWENYAEGPEEPTDTGDQTSWVKVTGLRGKAATRRDFKFKVIVEKPDKIKSFKVEFRFPDREPQIWTLDRVDFKRRSSRKDGKSYWEATITVSKSTLDIATAAITVSVVTSAGEKGESRASQRFDYVP